MSPTPGYPYRPLPRRRMDAGVKIAIVLGVVAFVCVAGLLAYALGMQPSSQAGATDNQAPPDRPAATATFNRAAWDEYWANWSGTSWGQAVTEVKPDGDTLIASTRLYPKVENKYAAVAICGTLWTFWQKPVKVNDGAGNVLASGSAGRPCAWRR